MGSPPGNLTSCYPLSNLEPVAVLVANHSRCHSVTPRRLHPYQHQHHPIRLPPSPISPAYSRSTPRHEYLQPSWCGGSQLFTPPVTQSPHEPDPHPRKRQKLNLTANSPIFATIEKDLEGVLLQPPTDPLPYDSLPSIFIGEPSPSPEASAYGLGQCHPNPLEYVPAWADDYEDDALNSIFAIEDSYDAIAAAGGSDFNATETPDDEVCFGMVSSAPPPAPGSLWLDGVC
jgi:hypothetical protein